MHLPIPEVQLKNILIQENLISPEKFDALLGEAERKNQNLIDVLVANKIVDSSYINSVVANLLGVELANLGIRKINKDVLRLLSEDTARQRQVIVFSREPDGTFDVAMLNPSDLETVEFLRQLLKAQVKPFLATQDDLNQGFSIYGSHSTDEFRRNIEDNIQASLMTKAKSAEEAAAQLPIVALVDNLLSYASAMRASDIHLEILEEGSLVRYRVDGILSEIMRLPKEVHNVVVTRIKILSGLKIDEHYKPQDGRFRYEIANQVIDVRVSVMPTFYGEKVEMRLLEASQKPLSLEELGMLPDMAKRVEASLKRTFGMNIICGPTGSGKTTTLYAVMNLINKPNVNIVTIEDPIEYNMRYVNQSQVNAQAGITFASALRAFLRQDPNIIMVGEIRDEETADIAVQAALTGHLLLSSVHTNDAPTVIPRFFDFKIPPFLVSSVLNIIIAQRLVRKICTSCIYSFKPSDETISIIQKQLDAMPNKAATARVPKMFYSGKGCAKCGMTGYKGRMGIFETVDVDEKIKDLIIKPDFDVEEVRTEAAKNGGSSMFEDGLMKVELGMTTIEEVLRVIRE